MLRKSKAKSSLDVMRDWKPENTIVAHGEYVFGNGEAFVRKSFSWIRK